MKVIVFTGAGLALLAGTALAQAPAVTPRDGVNTRAEVAQRVQTMFARLDTNSDGFVTREEAQAARTAMRGQREARRGERMDDRFERFDTDRNGSISRQEFDAFHAQRQAVRGERMNSARGGGAALGGHMFDMADENRDNRVSLAEATAAATRHFEMADSNKDGQVTREERRAMRQQMRQHRSN